MIDLVDGLTAVRGARRDEDVVITTMAAAREWMELGAGPRDFVFVPSCMGHATSIGLGLALAQPDRRIIVCNGDGSMLMNLGSLVTIAAAAPANLIVIVFDNGVYEVTGSQPTPGSRAVDFEAIARGAGYKAVFRFAHASDWLRAIDQVFRTTGPVFVTLDVEAEPLRPAPRSPGPAAERARAFMKALR